MVGSVVLFKVHVRWYNFSASAHCALDPALETLSLQLAVLAKLVSSSRHPGSFLLDLSVLDMSSTSTITSHLTTYASNFSRNISNTFDRLTLQDYIRLIIVIGAYSLLRPYLIKLGARFQAKDHEREIDPDELSSVAAVSPNSLKGKVHVPDDTDSGSEDEGRKRTDWGTKARRRQRKVIKQLLEEDEKRRREEEEAESDKEIEEFLVG